ncbi:MAG: hypothetical protein WD648_14550 [Planctomycetaceae bacterium]
MSNGNEIHSVTPFPLAMVVCDFIYRDPFTGKYTLTGLFSTIAGMEFPLVHPHLHVYTALTGGRGRIQLRLEITSADDDGGPLAVVQGEVDSADDPRVIQELGIVFGGLVFPKPGEYRISLYANNEFMVERRLLAFKPQQGTEHGD